MLAAMMAAPPSRKHHDAPQKNRAQDGERTSPPLIRWSIRETRRIAIRLTNRRLQPADIVAWSLCDGRIKQPPQIPA